MSTLHTDPQVDHKEPAHPLVSVEPDGSAPPKPLSGNVYDSVADAIGNTPLVRLNRVTRGIAATVYAKLEFANPGGSVKDRAAREMIRAAEISGDLRPGGTIVEGTSGNTGIGLALVGSALGYRTIVVLPDKSSADKIRILRAYGADVRVTPGSLPTDHPDHVRNLARRIADTTRGGWLADQYDNPANPAAHEHTTGPELWAQTQGRITHFVAGIGTGGTITGAGRYLKAVSGGRVRVVGAEPFSSSYGGGDGRASYIESIGHFRHPASPEDRWPESFHPDVVDDYLRIPDLESLLVATRLAREEGLLVGASSGTAVAAALRLSRTLGPEDVVVVLLPDSGRSYLSKYYDRPWLDRLGFAVNPEQTAAIESLAVGEVFAEWLDESGLSTEFVPATATVGEALTRFGRAHRGAMGDRPVDVLPVLLDRGPAAGPALVSEFVGTAHLERLRSVRPDDLLEGHLNAPLPTVGAHQSIQAAVDSLTGGAEAIAVTVDGRIAAVLPRSVVLEHRKSELASIDTRGRVS